MQSIKVYSIVNYIKAIPFCFEVIEVQEQLNDILYSFGIVSEFTDWEKKMIVEELIKLAEQFEFSEVLKMVFGDDDFFTS